MSLVTSHWPNGSHRLGHPTGAHHWGMFGHFSRVHGWLCTAPDPLEGTVLGSQLLTHRWPWYAMVIIWVSPKNFLKSIEIRWTQGVCALHRLTGTGLPGPLADSVEELLQVCAPHGGQLLHNLAWHTTSPNTNEFTRCWNPSYPVRSPEIGVETSNTKVIGLLADSGNSSSHPTWG